MNYLNFESLENILRTRFYYLGDSFGGSDNLLLVLQNNCRNDKEYIHKVYTLISYQDQIRVISPWASRFSLLENIRNKETYTLRDLDNAFYSIYNYDYELLYRVKINERKEWGNSSFDKLLLLQSLTGEIFYLQFPTDRGLKETILIVNNTSLVNSNTLADNDNLNIPEKVNNGVDSHSELPFENKKAYGNYIRFISRNNDIEELDIYIYPEKDLSIPTVTEIINSVDTQVYEYYLGNNMVSINPLKNSWILLKDRKSGKYLQTEIFRGEGSDRYLKANTFVSYIALQTSKNVETRRNQLGYKTNIPADISQDREVRLEVWVY